MKITFCNGIKDMDNFKAFMKGADYDGDIKTTLNYVNYLWDRTEKAVFKKEIESFGGTKMNVYEVKGNKVFKDSEGNTYSFVRKDRICPSNNHQNFIAVSLEKTDIIGNTESIVHQTLYMSNWITEKYHQDLKDNSNVLF